MWYVDHIFITYVLMLVNVLELGDVITLLLFFDGGCTSVLLLSEIYQSGM